MRKEFGGCWFVCWSDDAAFYGCWHMCMVSVLNWSWGLLAGFRHRDPRALSRCGQMFGMLSKLDPKAGTCRILSLSH